MTTGRAKGIRAGRAFVEVGGDDTQLARVLRRASARLKAFGAGVAKIGAGFAAVGAAISAPLVAATGIFAKFGDQLDKTAARTGLSVEALSELGFAAERSGASLENVEKAVRKLQISTRNALDGDAAFADAFKDLGINAEEFAKLSPEDQFTRIGEALSRVVDPGRRAALAVELLGKSGAQLLPLLNGGADGIEALREEARRLGLTIDTETATSAALLADALGDVKSQVRAVAVAIGGALGPTLTQTIRLINPIVARVIEIVKANKAVVLAIATGASALAGLGVAFIALGGAITLAGVALGGFASLLGVIGGILAAILSPIALVTAGVIGLGVAAFRYTSLGTRALGLFQAAWEQLGSRAVSVLGAIRSALIAGDLGAAVEVLSATVLLAWEIGKDAILSSAVSFGASFLQVINSIVGKALTSVFRGVDAAVQIILQGLDAIGGTNLAGTVGNALSAGFGTIASDIEESVQDRDATLELLRQLTRDAGDGVIDAARQKLEEAIKRANDLAAQTSTARSPELDDIADQLDRQIEVFGSFGGGRLDQQFGSAGNAVANRQLDEQKKTAKNTAQIARAIDTLSNRLAFG